MAFKTLVFLVIFKFASSMPDPNVNVNVNVNVEDRNGCNGCTSGCVFGFKTYEDGAIIEDECMRLKCLKGNWKYLGIVNHECGECQVWGDPHFTTFDNHTGQDPMGSYEFQGEGTYVISQQGYENNSMFGLKSTFVLCSDDGSVTCVNSAIYYEPGIVVSLSLPAPDNQCVGDNDTLCEIQVMVNGEEQSLGKAVHSYYATDGTILIFEHDHIMADDLNCINIVGSKGLSVSFCVHASNYAFLYVWPRASLKGEIYGLCGVFTGNEVASYTMRGGSMTDDTNSFGESWVFGDSQTLQGRTSVLGRCIDAAVLAKVTAQCTVQNIDVCLPPTLQCPIKMASCIYDLCHVPNPDSYANGYASHAAVQTKLATSSCCSTPGCWVAFWCPCC